jgi:hypothetical protein
MHPTADTLLLIFDNLAGQRVMPGVRRLLIVTAQAFGAIVPRHFAA